MVILRRYLPGQIGRLTRGLTGINGRNKETVKAGRNMRLERKERARRKWTVGMNGRNRRLGIELWEIVESLEGRHNYPEVRK